MLCYSLRYVRSHDDRSIDLGRIRTGRHNNGDDFIKIGRGGRRRSFRSFTRLINGEERCQTSSGGLL